MSVMFLASVESLGEWQNSQANLEATVVSCQNSEDAIYVLNYLADWVCVTYTNHFTFMCLICSGIVACHNVFAQEGALLASLAHAMLEQYSRDCNA